MTSKRAATAAFDIEVKSPVWAVLEGGAIARHGGCCNATGGREEPTPTYAAGSKNNDNILIASIRCALHGEHVNRSINAWISSIGAPEPPEPLINTIVPS